MDIVGYATVLILIIVMLWVWSQLRKRKRSAFIDSYPFHAAVVNKLREVRPELTPAQELMVFEALREYFHICNTAGRQMVSMPSQVVDDAWHGFILFTRGYRHFCRHAFGRFLHHTPAEAMQSPTLAQDGIKRAWRIACTREGIDPKTPSRLPRLFAIDAELNIANGFRYVTDCKDSRQTDGSGGAYCGSDIGCGGGCSGDSGDSGCGGGCGGD